MTHFLTLLVGDCHNSAGQKNMCVTGAINNYTMQLMSADKDFNTESKCKFPILRGFCRGYDWGTHSLSSTDNLTEALMFLSHFIGDIHQVCSPFYFRGLIYGKE